jgi:hypothetical protein
MQLTEEQMRDLAQRRVAAKKSFFHSLAVYCIINVVLILFWAISGGGRPWFLWVLFFWGLGLLFQALHVFAFPKEGGDWEVRQYQKELDKIRKTRS